MADPQNERPSQFSVAPSTEGKPWGAIIGTVLISVGLFVLLPLTQLIEQLSRSSFIPVASAEMPPPPPPPPPPPEQEDEEEQDDVEELEQEQPPPPLDMLELSLNADVSGIGGGDFSMPSFDVSDDFSDMLFDLEDLDEIPRVTSQPSPIYPHAMQRAGISGRVTVFFIVDETGSVRSPRVEDSSNPAFERPALDAVRKWKFTAGVKDGRKVKTKMRITIPFQISRR